MLLVTVPLLLTALAMPATAVPASGSVLVPAQPTPPKHFNTRGDYVHISRTPPRAASAHGWWERIDNEAPLALVTVQLQIKRLGPWLDVGAPGSEVVKAGGGSANRANARVPCVGFGVHEWRSVVDVDLIGYVDSAERTITSARTLPCAA